MSTTKLIVAGVSLVAVIGGMIYAKRKQNQAYKDLAHDAVKNALKDMPNVAQSMSQHHATLQEQAAQNIATTTAAGAVADAKLDQAMARMRNHGQATIQ